MDAILDIQNLCKRYGDHVAVDDLSFSVPRGSVFGLLGPNGAGKTTTIRMVMRIIASDSGTVLLDGQPVDDDRRRIIGYLPEERGLYKKMKVLEHLVYLGTIRGIRSGRSEEARRGLARAFRARGVGDPQGRGPVEGDAAEDPVHRHHPSPAAAFDPRRAVLGPRPDQHPGAQGPAPRHGR